MRLPQHQAIYDERMVAPMRQELTRIGFEELRTPEQVDSALKDAPGTTLVVVNSICGCAARNARPAVTLALGNEAKPEKLTTVFAGQDLGNEAKPEKLTTVFAGQDVEATQRAREYFTGYPPSSPSIGLLKDGRLVYMLERWQIEGRPAQDIAEDLVEAFDKYC